MAQAFGPESQREFARDHFVGNEAGSDEYGERWPWKGFGFISSAADILEDSEDERRETFIEQVQTWTAAMGLGRYEGSEAAVPMLETIFDILWDNGTHPYYGNDRQGFLDQYVGYHDDEADGERMAAEFAPFVALGETDAKRWEDRTLADAERIRARRAAE